MRKSLRELLRARLVGFTREPEAVFWTFGFPVMIAVALGIAFRNKGPEKIYVAVEGTLSSPDRPPAPRLVDGKIDEERFNTDATHRALVADSALDVTMVSHQEATERLRTGKAAVVVVPGDPLTFRLDPSRPESRVARLEVEAALDRAADRPAMYRAQSDPVTQPGSRYIDFLIPGLIGMNVLSASIFGIGWSIVDARGRKLLKRFAATPMPRGQYLASFIIAHVILVTAMLVFVLGFARVAFDVRVFGSYLAVLVLTVFGATAFAGLGILLACRTDKSETLSGMSNAVMLPMFVASGVFFSSEHFPGIVQPLIKVLPLTAFNDALRAVMNDGAPLLSQWAPLLVLAVWGVVTFSVALRWFRWT